MQGRGARAALIESPDIDQADVARLAIRYRIATMVNGEGGYVERGGLMGYNPVHTDAMRSTAVIIEKIFRGIKPADIPWQLPDRTQIEINLRTAKALGLAIPPDILLRADKVFE
jgi:putative ABC transport system substrate-binding protein